MSQQSDCRSTIERAFEIAASGSVKTIADIRTTLNNEGYFTQVLTGPVLLKQLRQRMVKPPGKP